MSDVWLKFHINVRNITVIDVYSSSYLHTCHDHKFPFNKNKMRLTSFFFSILIKRITERNKTKKFRVFTTGWLALVPSEIFLL
jgi:hypothetical protein